MTRLANEIRESSRPIYCSACFNSQPIRHVDFDAACDRGYGENTTVKINMDDLILCENCVREGLLVLDIQDSEELKTENANLVRELKVERRLRKEAQDYAYILEQAVSKRPEKIRVDRRAEQRPVRTGVS